MTRHPNGETVLVHPWIRDDRNAHGKLTPVFGPDVVVGHVAVAPGRQTETVADGDTTTTVEWTTYLPPSAVVTSRDQVTVRGGRYGVNGEMAGLWSNPFTRHAPGSVAELLKVKG